LFIFVLYQHFLYTKVRKTNHDYIKFGRNKLYSVLLSDSDSTTEINSSSSQQSSISLHSSSSVAEIEASPLHRFAFNGNFDSLRKLILERDADVNLPLKDGSTPLLKATEKGHDGII
jgi:ankyrin repeat protein